MIRLTLNGITYQGTAQEIAAQAAVRAVGTPRPALKLPGGPGTKLKKMLAKFKLTARPGCKCEEHVREMDFRGPQWCRDNIDTIVGWLREEAHRANLPFTELGAKILVKRAIAMAERADSKPNTARSGNGEVSQELTERTEIF